MTRRSRPALAAMCLSLALALLAGCSTGAASPTSSPVPIAATASPLATVAVTVAPTPLPTVAIVKITPIPGAPDSGIVVKLTARSVKWSLSTINAPAGKVWHVRLDQQDPPPGRHNFVVASGPTFVERIFTSPVLVLGVYTLDIPALPAGSYLFICAIHPIEMTGTLTIG